MAPKKAQKLTMGQVNLLFGGNGGRDVLPTQSEGKEFGKGKGKGYSFDGSRGDSGGWLGKGEGKGYSRAETASDWRSGGDRSGDRGGDRASSDWRSGGDRGGFGGRGRVGRSGDDGGAADHDDNWRAGGGGGDRRPGGAFGGGVRGFGDRDRGRDGEWGSSRRDGPGEPQRRRLVLQPRTLPLPNPQEGAGAGGRRDDEDRRPPRSAPLGSSRPAAARGRDDDAPKAREREGEDGLEAVPTRAAWVPTWQRRRMEEGQAAKRAEEDSRQQAREAERRREGERAAEKLREEERRKREEEGKRRDEAAAAAAAKTGKSMAKAEDQPKAKVECDMRRVQAFAARCKEAVGSMEDIEALAEDVPEHLGPAELKTVLPADGLLRHLLPFCRRKDEEVVFEQVRRLAPLLAKLMEAEVWRFKCLVLRAAQRICHEMGLPRLSGASSLLEAFFDALYRAGVVEEQYFLWWAEDDRDTTPGKTSALFQVGDFLAFLRNARVEGEESTEEELSEDGDSGSDWDDA